MMHIQSTRILILFHLARPDSPELPDELPDSAADVTVSLPALCSRKTAKKIDQKGRYMLCDKH